jgi:hypothetical protein
MHQQHHATCHSHTFVKSCVSDYNTSVPERTKYELRNSGSTSVLVAILWNPSEGTCSITLYTHSTKAELSIGYKGFIQQFSSLLNPLLTPPTTGRSLLEYNGLPAAPVVIQPDRPAVQRHHAIRIKGPISLPTMGINLHTQLCTTLKHLNNQTL